MTSQMIFNTIINDYINEDLFSSFTASDDEGECDFQ